MCRFFTEGACFYINGEKVGCWYLHKQATAITGSPNISDNLPCTNCDNIFKSPPEVMKHRLQHHEEEVPEANSIKEGKPCLKKTRCGFRHPKPTGNVLLQNVPAQTVCFPENFSTHNNGLEFWPTL